MCHSSKVHSKWTQPEPRGKGFIVKGNETKETQVPNNYMKLLGTCVSLGQADVF